MTRKRLILLAAGGSAALLLAAWGFQAFGYAPCKMCLWQRWPHVAAVAIGLVALFLPYVLLPILGALAAATTAVIGVYHAGVEKGWFEGPDTCTSNTIDGLSSEQLMDQILNAPLIRCDEVAWALMGLSMAGWNALLSFALAGVWVWAACAKYYQSSTEFPNPGGTMNKNSDVQILPTLNTERGEKRAAILRARFAKVSVGQRAENRRWRSVGHRLAISLIFLAIGLATLVIFDRFR